MSTGGQGGKDSGRGLLWVAGFAAGEVGASEDEFVDACAAGDAEDVVEVVLGENLVYDGLVLGRRRREGRIRVIEVGIERRRGGRGGRAAEVRTVVGGVEVAVDRCARLGELYKVGVDGFILDGEVEIGCGCSRQRFPSAQAYVLRFARCSPELTSVEVREENMVAVEKHKNTSPCDFACRYNCCSAVSRFRSYHRKTQIARRISASPRPAPPPAAAAQSAGPPPARPSPSASAARRPAVRRAPRAA